MLLAKIFSSKAQAELIEYLINNRVRFYNQIALASAIDVSSSTISRLVENLAKINIVKYARFEKGVKVIVFNDESPLSKSLVKFYSEIKKTDI
jgi:uncharacterized membrane protein